MQTRTFAEWMADVDAYVAGPAAAWAQQIETTGAVPQAVWQELNDRGYLRLAAPRDFGGFGLTFVEYLRLLERFAAMHGSMRVIVHVMNSLWRSLASKASLGQMERFVKPFIAGQLRATFTLTEPNSGSGADIKTTARREGDEYVVNGEKWMIIFSDVADYFLLFCRLEGTSGGEGTLALMVPRDAMGLQIEYMAPAMGVTGTQHGHLRLSNCRVPVANRLGEEGDGLEVAFRGFLDPSRTAIGMTCVGAAQRSLDLATEHALTRVTFGQPLAKRQVIQMWLAEMATDIAAARQLVLHAARKLDEGHSITVDASMAKMFATEMLQRVTDKALQIHGGPGYFQSSEIERLYRDARMQRFEEGTSEIQKMVIARDVLDKAKAARERRNRG
ncbi:alkylation response protein AidB-like acyl-CoA dehydrogenase [Alicyclobacillus sacchari]|uniref:Alkylation response protein AidB-like acyl-CoA dehydrogenase n=1 Tax=Alicyclobacillus sacchari TaxID=392010 RepID=A0A4R8LUJ5_9BACL|nr:acyl-CoA dehydrogenase family protein [Alicyclobacillus sacchari]TDY51344.1 alkylation response protein AidB-like acyl-CoA dehydrogenase [Alicyclobacillus sacchari]GMA56656.1 acyl-CoA dehydrogenase [Alicyclobacillus sacchari]